MFYGIIFIDNKEGGKMIQIFDIKKEKSLKMNDSEMLKKYIDESILNNEELMKKYNSKVQGLNDNEVKIRLSKNGKNVVIKDDKKSPLYFLLMSFKDEFIIILLFLSLINFLLGDTLGSLIIVVIGIISALIRFFQDYSVYKFNRKLKSKIYSTVNVLRNNEEKEVKVENVVIGDIIKLNAGTIIPADLRIIDSKDLFLNESVFTGESILVEKSNKVNNNVKEIFDINNICLMGTSVVSGRGEGIVINTGFNTYLGKVGKEVNTKKEVTNFDKGIKNITKLLIRYMVVVCLAVIVIDGIIKQNIGEALLFALSVAVGITPSMLPMILNVNLTKGSKSLANKKTLVKNIASIQNLGAIDILCTDKTGTLTENNITLQKYIDALGNENEDILEYAYLNSYYSTGIKNLIDKAIISYGKEHKLDTTLEKYEKVDEIPFDYNRKKQSVVVKNKSAYRMITKGALEEIINDCDNVVINGEINEITKELINVIKDKAMELANNGMQVIALAEKNDYPGNLKFNSECEKNMTFVGFTCFLDPAKKDVKTTISNLYKIGVKTKILTGDNPYATKNICNLVGLNGNDILLGSDIDKMSDEELSKKIEDIDVFARMNPLQKERIVDLYKKNGHVVGYMGDGVNDAPSLNKSDVGISVNSASSIAKEASDIIILKQSLKVVYDGVIEGRKVYGNIIKYMKMALSADFGDVFSIMISSIFLPFLPLLPIQMLLQDFIYDFSQIGIPYDNVDKEFLIKPKKWDTKGISRFMKVMGITSSIIDVISFIIFWFVLGYNSIDKQAYFQTAWFITCLVTELMIIYNVRTSKKPFIESNASHKLNVLTIFSLVLTIITPMLLTKIGTFHFVILPFEFYLFLILLVILYFAIVSIIKKIYIKKYGEWL